MRLPEEFTPQGIADKIRCVATAIGKAAQGEELVAAIGRGSVEVSAHLNARFAVNEARIANRTCLLFTTISKRYTGKVLGE